MKKNIFKALLFCFVTVQVCKAQDTIKYPFIDGINITFGQVLQTIGNGWMHKDNGCSTGLYFVEIWFDKESRKANIFIPDNLPRQFADSIRLTFTKTAFIWDTSQLSTLTTSFIQPIYIDDVDCLSKKDVSENQISNEIYLDIYLNKNVSTKESIIVFFNKIANNVKPRRYYFLELSVVKEPIRNRKWSM